MVVSYPPGAITDTVGRRLAERLGLVLGTSAIIENRAGARHSVRSDRQGETAMRRRTLVAASGMALVSREQDA
jgi:tripartite-type tricarboxylate transporter receptor subunit TctC